MSLPRTRHRRPSAPVVLAACGLLAVVAASSRIAGAVSSGRPAATSAQFASSVDLVEVYATVTDRAGSPVSGLGAADFEVLEDGRSQAIQAFAAGDFPLSVALALDHSASMAGSRLRLVQTRATAFLGRLRPEDQVMVLGIASEVVELAALSTDRPAQVRAIQGLRPWSTTPLNDAIIAGLGRIQAARGRRGLIVLSDGEDRYSEARTADVLEQARRASVMVYPVAIGKRLPPLFPQLAALTGGRSFHASDPQQLDRALSEVAGELRQQYLLGYAPGGDPPDGPAAWRTIEVRVRRSGVRVRARDGYYAGRQR